MNGARMRGECSQSKQNTEATWLAAQVTISIEASPSPRIVSS
jgi:hypothetical protein